MWLLAEAPDDGNDNARDDVPSPTGEAHGAKDLSKRHDAEKDTMPYFIETSTTPHLQHAAPPPSSAVLAPVPLPRLGPVLVQPALVLQRVRCTSYAVVQ